MRTTLVLRHSQPSIRRMGNGPPKALPHPWKVWEPMQRQLEEKRPDLSHTPNGPEAARVLRQAEISGPVLKQWGPISAAESLREECHQIQPTPAEWLHFDFKDVPPPKKSHGSGLNSPSGKRGSSLMAPGRPLPQESNQAESPLGEFKDTPEDLSEPNNGTQAGSRPTPTRRALPISPLMDPSYLATLEKYKEGKRVIKGELSPFQQRLERNPYAQALTTPVRQCVSTRTWLPRFFLQDFQLIAHPETNEPWYLPQSLAGKSIIIPTTKPNDKWRRNKTAGLYTLGRYDLIKAITEGDKNSRYHNSWRFWHKDKQIAKDRGMQPRFRPDMHTFISRALAKRVVKEFKKLSGLRNGYLIACKDYEDARRKTQVGAILWLGKPQGDEDGELHIYDPALDGPAEFTTLELENRARTKLPVYNMLRLVGQSAVDELRLSCPEPFGGEVTVIKDKKTTLEIQLILWKLQCYFAQLGYIDSKQAGEEIEAGTVDVREVELDEVSDLDEDWENRWRGNV